MTITKIRSLRRPALAVALAASLGLAVAPALAQSPRGTAEGTVGGASVSVEYGRPSLAGRDMLSRVEDGMVWRLGADQSTTLTTSAALEIGDASLAAGSYSLFARKTADGWVLLVNSATGQWGTEHESAKDVAEVPLSVSTGESVEQFTISIEEHGGSQMLHFAWGETTLMASVSAGS